jgi:hypothetical protein
MRITTKREIDAVLALDGPARYRHFVKRVVDSGLAWGLWNEGWALLGDDSGDRVFPLWPALEYADRARAGEWISFEPRPIDLTDLLDDLLPRLAASQVRPGVFPTLDSRATTPTPEELAHSLRKEMEGYE